MKRLTVLATVGALCGVLTACDEDTHTPTPEPMPSGDPTPEEFVEFSELPLPDDLDNLTIDRSHNESGGLHYEVTFATSRTGAKMFCDIPESFTAYGSIEGPDGDERDEFSIPAGVESVDGRTICRGGHPTEPEVNRKALILYPDDKQAKVYVYAERLNTR